MINKNVAQDSRSCSGRSTLAGGVRPVLVEHESIISGLEVTRQADAKLRSYLLLEYAPSPIGGVDMAGLLKAVGAVKGVEGTTDVGLWESALPAACCLLPMFLTA